MSKDKYRQCTLVKNNVATVSYIPSEYAIVGKILKLKKDDDTWSDGWVVESAGALTSSPPDYRKDIRAHKKMTGDSLPKKETSK
jgi:hypothetical protein